MPRRTLQQILGLLILAVVYTLCLTAAARGGTITISNSAEAAQKIGQVQNGDEVVFANGTYGVNVTLVGKSNITLRAANIGTVTVARQADGTPLASGPTVTLDGGGQRWTFRQVNCTGVVTKGITFSKGGVRLENSPNATFQGRHRAGFAVRRIRDRHARARER
jgi:hypothetical protein